MLSRVKRETHAEVGIYKAEQRSMCPTKIKWHLGTHHLPPSNITFSYTSGSNRWINKSRQQLTEITLGGRLQILKPRFHSGFSPSFFQLVKQLSATRGDVNNVQHRQRSVLLAIKSAQSPNNISGNTGYKKLCLLPISPLVTAVFIPGHWACLSASKHGSKFSGITPTVSTPKTQMKKFRFAMILSTLVFPVYYSLLRASYDWHESALPQVI